MNTRSTPSGLAQIAKEPQQRDAINPTYYQLSNGAQLFDLTEHLDFLRGSAIKYVFRAGEKDPAKEIEDLQKAKRCIDRRIEFVTKQRGGE